MHEIETGEKDIKNEELFWYYFKYQSPSFLVKNLLKAKQTKYELILNEVNDALIDLKNAISRNETSENENPNEIINFVEKNLRL